MTAQQFVEQLYLSAPPVAELRKVGASEIEIKETLARYTCKPRIPPPDPALTNPLIYLVTNYNVANFNIGSVQFKSNIEVRENKTVFGNFEIDSLIINNESEEIFVEESPSDGHVLWECAQNGSKFLDALVIAAKFLGRCGWDNDFCADQASHHRAARECTAAAGGDRYRDFYLVICGCD